VNLLLPTGIGAIDPDEIARTLMQWAPIAIGILVVFLVLILCLKAFLYICPPNEVMIFSGRTHRLADGTRRKYAIIAGGRRFIIPVVERVDRMSLNLMEVPISIRNAYSRGGIPLNVDAVANIKISSNERIMSNAIERFLGRDMGELRRVAKETLEGHVRGVLATLTPEEINEDRLAFAEALGRESEEDLNKLGLHVDTLKILHVTDEVHYLDSIGRSAIANVIREAEIAEAEFKRAAEQAIAENEGRANVTQANVEANIVKMRNEIRKIQADLEAQVKSEEERTQAAAREARAKAEQELQKIRAELAAVQLQVDTVLPAEAQREAREFQARGDAALIRERGVAVSKALDQLNNAWNEAGSSALQIALIEDLEKILAAASQGVTKVQIGELHVIDSGQGKVLPNYIAGFPAMLDSVFDAVERTTGIDIPSSVAGKDKEEAK